MEKRYEAQEWQGEKEWTERRDIKKYIIFLFTSAMPGAPARMSLNTVHAKVLNQIFLHFGLYTLLYNLSTIWVYHMI